MVPFSRMLAVFILLFTPLSALSAAEDIARLGDQLRLESGYRSAIQQLAGLAENNQAAMRLLLAHACEPEMNGATVYVRTDSWRQALKMVSVIAESGKISEEALHVFVDEVLRCGAKQGRGQSHLAIELHTAQKNETLDMDDIALLSSYLQKVINRLLKNPEHRKSPIGSIIDIMSNQSRRQRLPKSAIAFVGPALELSDRFRLDRDLLNILGNQIKYHGAHIEPLLLHAVKFGKSPKSRGTALRLLGVWYAHPDREERGVATVHRFCEGAESSELVKVCAKILPSLASQLNDDSVLHDKIYAGLDDSGKAEVIRAKLERLDTAVQKRALSSHELEQLFGMREEYQRLHPSSAAHAPIWTILKHAKRHGLTQEWHEALLLSYVQKHDYYRNYTYLKNYFIGSYPHRIDQIAMPGAPYSDDFIHRLLAITAAEHAPASRRAGLGIIHTIIASQPISLANLEQAWRLGISDTVPSGILSAIIKALPTDESLAAYQSIVEMIRTDLRSQQPHTASEGLEVVLRYDGLRVGETEALYALFEDTDLYEAGRFVGLGRIVRRDLPNASQRILQNADRLPLNIQQQVWETFRYASLSGQGLVDKDILLDATQHEEISIRDAAWTLLEQQGVNPPHAGVTVERFIYGLGRYDNLARLIFKLTLLAFPLVLIAGFFLLVPCKELRERGATMGGWRFLGGVLCAVGAALAGGFVAFVYAFGFSMHVKYLSMIWGILAFYLLLMYSIGLPWGRDHCSDEDL